MKALKTIVYCEGLFEEKVLRALFRLGVSRVRVQNFDLRISPNDQTQSFASGLSEHHKALECIVSNEIGQKIVQLFERPEWVPFDIEIVFSEVDWHWMPSNENLKGTLK
jgi:hypothetical protein